MDSNNNINDNKIYNYDKLNFHELIRKNSVYILIERLISPVINFIVAVIIIRTISTDDYGIYNMLLAILGYIFLFSSVGIPEIFMRYIPEFFQKKQIKELKDLVKLGLFYRLILCLGFLLLIIIFSKQLGQILNIGLIIHYLAIFSVAIVTNLLSGLLGIVLTSVFQHKNYSISQVSYFCIRALLIYYLLKTGKGLIGLLVAESVANVYLLLVQYIYYRKYLKRQPQSRQGALPFKRILKFGGYIT